MSFVNVTTFHSLKLDMVDVLAVSFLLLGGILFFVGVTIDTRALSEFLQVFVDEWTPGFVIDGLLLLVVNRIIRRNERNNVLAQVGSLSNDFALDAVRRARTEGWLEDGSMTGRELRKAKLATADLSGARLTKADLRYADLTDTSLTHADLREANLTGANLRNADLRWADLRGAKLSWADMMGARVEGARFEDAEVRFASVDAEFRVAQPQDSNGTIEGGHLRCHQVATLRSSFAMIEAAGEQAIGLFYDNLFDAKPDLRAMFSASQKRQSQKFLQSLKVIVGSLGEPERSIEVLEQLGRRHQSMGIQAAHYELAGAVLLATLADFFGEEFTVEVQDAWQAGFTLIANVMIQAAA
ncbi:MAG: hypothetical protein GKR90_01095 [Pseudomonadales bacterium]|nr:hypothetical protein [Pseudomonadales bacterium]